MAVLLLVAALLGAAPGADAQAESKPSAAVAMGDSFISGEGAGDYQPVSPDGGPALAFPGWTADNSHPYFCHRSANASIEVAALSAIDARFNIACSGGVTGDLVNASSTRAKGRDIDAQLTQLRRIATTHDIDLVLYGMGANDVGFADAAKACVNGFLTDAYTGWWEGWINIWAPHSTTKGACSSGDFPGPSDIAQATGDFEASLRRLVETLDEVDADGQYRIVVQNYVNPMPDRFATEYESQNHRNDRRDKFRALARERYAAGCPVHTSALPKAAAMTASLGSMVAEAQHRVLLDHPGADIVFLDVEAAFDGSRLCENTGSPVGALHTPVRALDTAGRPITSLAGKNKLDVKDMFDDCENHYQLCQESLHPNAAGHDLLGQCLAGAWAADRAVVTCHGRNGEVRTVEQAPRIEPNLNLRVFEGIGRNGEAVLDLDASWGVRLLNAPGRTIGSVAVRFNTGTATVATGSGASGAVSANVRCVGEATMIYGSVTVTLDDGTRLGGGSSVSADCPGGPGSRHIPKR